MAPEVKRYTTSFVYFTSEGTEFDLRKFNDLKIIHYIKYQ